LQRLTDGALLAHVPPSAELWLDGGHNPNAGAAIAEAMADLEDRVPSPLVLVAGMLNTKDATGFFRPLAPRVAAARTVTIPGEGASLTAEETAQAARAAGLAAEPAPSLEAAVADLGCVADRPTRILICGSLYLAGQVLAENG
jgi:dihydrofolate synthase/folylpolyglutamate synthase